MRRARCRDCRWRPRRPRQGRRAAPAKASGRRCRARRGRASRRGPGSRPGTAAGRGRRPAAGGSSRIVLGELGPGDYRQASRRRARRRHGSCKYTSRYTRTPLPGMDPSSLLTLSDWADAYAAGASPRALLHVLRERLAAAQRPAPGSRAPIAPPSTRSSTHSMRASPPTRSCVGAARAAAARRAVRGQGQHRRRRRARRRRPARRSPTRRAQRAPWSQRLLDAGAIVVGKTNLDQFATGLVGARSPYGAPASAFADRSHQRRLELGLGGGGGARRRRLRARHRHRRIGPGAGRLQQHRRVEADAAAGVGTAGVVPACRTPRLRLDLRATASTMPRACCALDRGRRRGRSVQRTSSPARPRLPGRLRIGIPRRPRLRRRGGLRQRVRRAPLDAAGLGAHAASNSISRRCSTSPRCSTTAPGSPSATPRAARSSTAQPEAMDPTVRRIVARALRYTATDAFAASYELRRRAAANAPMVGRRRPADGADRARPPDLRRGRRRPDRRRTRDWACTPISSTCSAGARSRFRPANRRPGCRSA